MAKIIAPVKDFSGDIAGVQFSNGTAETDNAAVISYCAGAGYTVELDESTALDRPAKSASKADWVAYAAQEGHDVEGLNKDDLVALFADKETETPPAGDTPPAGEGETPPGDGETPPAGEESEEK